MEKQFEFKFRGHDREVTLSLNTCLGDWIIGPRWFRVINVFDSICYMVALHFLCFNLHIEYWRWAK